MTRGVSRSRRPSIRIIFGRILTAVRALCFSIDDHKSQMRLKNSRSCRLLFRKAYQTAVDRCATAAKSASKRTEKENVWSASGIGCPSIGDREPCLQTKGHGP